MKNLVIKRSEWLRAGCGTYVDVDGEENDWDFVESQLYNPQYNRYCCLGLYAKSCGFNKDDLAGFADPADLRYSLFSKSDLSGDKGSYFADLLADPDLDPDLDPDSHGNSDLACELININDDCSITNSEREEKIAKLFSQINVNVAFED